MWWPWKQETERLKARAEAAGLEEVEKVKAALAEAHLKETRGRIDARWAAAEQAITARRVVSRMKLAAQLAPTHEHRASGKVLAMGRK